MYRLISSLLIALAMFVSPLAMAGAAGMAMPHGTATAQSDDHCAGGEAPAEQDNGSAKAGCASACAACLPMHLASPDQAPVAAPGIAMATFEGLTGLHPESETPPPRNLSTN